MGINHCGVVWLVQGRLGIFYGNKSQSELQGFSATLDEASHIRVQVQDPPSTVAGLQQAKQQIMVECMRPFDYNEAPNLAISFTLDGQPYLYELIIPIVPTNFMEPVTLSAQVRRKRLGVK